MSNRERISSELAKHGVSIGVYDTDLERLSANQIETVLEIAVHGSCDVEVSVNGVDSIVEVMYVDNEVDFHMLPKADYDEQYN